MYKVYLRQRQRIVLRLDGPRGANSDLVLWKPGTLRVEGLAIDLRRLAARSARRGSNERISYRAPAAGWYYVQVKITQPGAGAYRLAFSKS